MDPVFTGTVRFYEGTRFRERDPDNHPERHFSSSVPDHPVALYLRFRQKGFKSACHSDCFVFSFLRHRFLVPRNISSIKRADDFLYSVDHDLLPLDCQIQRTVVDLAIHHERFVNY
jgi:hypothetical protein